jgi:hypothetical protein
MIISDAVTLAPLQGGAGSGFQDRRPAQNLSEKDYQLAIGKCNLRKYDTSRNVVVKNAHKIIATKKCKPKYREDTCTMAHPKRRYREI